MKEIRLYYDCVTEDTIWDEHLGSGTNKIIANCMSKNKEFTFSNFGFLITSAAGKQNYIKHQSEFKLVSYL